MNTKNMTEKEIAYYCQGLICSLMDQAHEQNETFKRTDYRWVFGKETAKKLGGYPYPPNSTIEFIGIAVELDEFRPHTLGLWRKMKI